MDAKRDKREARKKLFFERYSPVILRILMHGEVDKKKKLAETIFPNWRRMCGTKEVAVGVLVARD